MDVYTLTDDAILHEIGSKLKELRNGKGLKQSELAEESGIRCIYAKNVISHK